MFFEKLIPQTIFIDSTNIFSIKNPNIPLETKYHTFLLDPNNNVVLVGNPITNKKIREIFLAKIENVSCDNKLNNSISLADSNKEALDSVLEHFEHDSNPLKYEAAKFLIENMPFHQSTTGETAEKYAEACYVWNVQKFNKSIK